MKNIWVPVVPVLTIVLATCGAAYEQNTGLRGAIADHGKSVNGLVFLQRLQDKSCADLYLVNGTLSSDQMKKERSCNGPVSRGEVAGTYDFSGIEPGWYILRFQWEMKNPPDSKKAIGCWIQGWAVSYVPWKESGKYKGFAQSPPFELGDKELKTVDFNYEGEFEVQKNCPAPLKWHKR